MLVVVFDVFVLFIRDVFGGFMVFKWTFMQCIRYVFRFSESAVLVKEGGR